MWTPQFGGGVGGTWVFQWRNWNIKNIFFWSVLFVFCFCIRQFLLFCVSLCRSLCSIHAAVISFHCGSNVYSFYCRIVAYFMWMLYILMCLLAVVSRSLHEANIIRTSSCQSSVNICVWKHCQSKDRSHVPDVLCKKNKAQPSSVLGTFPVCKVLFQINYM
jgi:hypothetical protein